MRRPIFVLLVLSLGFLSGCTVSQSPGLSPLQAEAEDRVLRRRSTILYLRGPILESRILSVSVGSAR
jgi:hypothetical protein